MLTEIRKKAAKEWQIKALLVATTVEEVASLVSIPFFFWFLIFFTNNLHTNKGKKNIKLTLKALYNLCQKGQKTFQNNQQTFWLVQEMTRPVKIVACTGTGKKRKKRKPKKIKMVHDCLVGGGKHLSASPRFLSTYMIHTCRYMHPRCIHLSVYSHAPTQQTSVNPSSRAVSLSSALNSHVLRSIKTFWPVLQRPTRTRLSDSSIPLPGGKDIYPHLQRKLLLFPFFLFHHSHCWRRLPCRAQTTSTSTQTAHTPANASLKKVILLTQKSHCRYLSLNICGRIIITHTSNFGVDSAGSQARAALALLQKKWKSGIPFTSLTWTVLMCWTCHSWASHV